MDEKNYFIDFSKITDEEIEKAKKVKEDSEYTIEKFVDDLTKNEND